MSKWKKPQETKMILEFSDSGSNIIFRRCYKAGQGHWDHAHLSAFSSSSIEVLWRMSDDASVCCTSKRQQWHIKRGTIINPQPWMRNHRWKNREHEVHRSGFTIELHRREKTLRKAKEIRYVLRNQFFRLEMMAQLLLQNMGWILQGHSRYAISQLELNASEKCDVNSVHVIFHQKCLGPLIQLLFTSHWSLFC